MSSEDRQKRTATKDVFPGKTSVLISLQTASISSRRARGSFEFLRFVTGQEKVWDFIWESQGDACVVFDHFSVELRIQPID